MCVRWHGTNLYEGGGGGGGGSGSSTGERMNPNLDHTGDAITFFYFTGSVTTVPDILSDFAGTVL